MGAFWNSARTARNFSWLTRISNSPGILYLHSPIETHRSNTNSILHKKLKEWLSCLHHQRKKSNRAKDWSVLNKQHPTFTDAEKYQLQPIEVNYIHLITGFRLRSSCIPHGGHIESLWECNDGRQGLEFSLEAIVVSPRYRVLLSPSPGCSQVS